MNQRIVELLKNPKIIQSGDIKILDHEIEKIPYIQSLRALRLYGTHLFQKERYSNELSTTAAYTTDKKILYQFIKGKIIPKPNYETHINTSQSKNTENKIDESINEIIKTEVSASNAQFQIQKNTLSPEKYTEVIPQEQQALNEVFVNGEKNRILFPGEENFLNEEKTPKIDLELTIESGIIVTEKPSPLKDLPAQEGSPETIVNEKKIQSENVIETIEASSELSFHGFEAFMPDVKIQQSDKIEVSPPNIPQQSSTKQADEMKKLIEEVERKMKEKKPNKSEEKTHEEELMNSEVNFSETQEFSFETKKLESFEQVSVQKEPTNDNQEMEIVAKEINDEIVETELKVENNVKSSIDVSNSTWKPMSLESNIPDALIGKNEEITIQKKPTEEQQNQLIETQNIEADRRQSEINITHSETETTNSTEFLSEQSNVSSFINTWQDWLKIDRTAEINAQKTEKKEKIIENFIESNPKISKLKEENNFVVKEKSDDISHLMTETLANLYLEQKLYSKATKAFQILIEKFPDRKENFENKIQEIKDIRNRN